MRFVAVATTLAAGEKAKIRLQCRTAGGRGDTDCHANAAALARNDTKNKAPCAVGADAHIGQRREHTPAHGWERS